MIENLDLQAPTLSLLSSLLCLRIRSPCGKYQPSIFSTVAFLAWNSQVLPKARGTACSEPQPPRFLSRELTLLTGSTCASCRRERYVYVIGQHLVFSGFAGSARMHPRAAPCFLLSFSVLRQSIWGKNF